jgi:hypothetical protein
MPDASIVKARPRPKAGKIDPLIAALLAKTDDPALQKWLRRFAAKPTAPDAAREAGRLKN